MPDVNSPAQPNLPSMPSGVFYVNYFDGISDSKVRGLMGLCTEIISKVKPAHLYFALSSPGGSVAAGITLYNFLKALPVEISMHNIGSVDSIATVIFMAGARRYACKHSRFLFHGVALTFGKDQVVNSAQMNEHISGLEQDEGRIKELIAERSELNAGELDALFRQGETKDPAFALQKRIIDDIRDFSIPDGAQVVTANFQ
jgi:ATP-dependent Clp protease protease subunit